MFTQIFFSQALGRKGRGCCEHAYQCCFTIGWKGQDEFLEELLFKLNLKDKYELIKQKWRRKSFQPEEKISQFQCIEREALFKGFFKIFSLLI